MKKSLIRVLLLFLITSCANNRIEISNRIEKSITAHGGYQNFEQLENLSYRKSTYVLNEEGQPVDSLIQTFIHPSINQTQLAYLQHDISYLAEMKDESLLLFVDDQPSEEASLLSTHKNLIDAANFIFFQPFKLGNQKAVFSDHGIKQLTISRRTTPLQVIGVSYPESTDRWYFFFDLNTLQVRANAVWHNEKMSLILNEEMQWHHGLLLHHKRTSYLSNQNFELIRPQATYTYEMLD